MKFAIMLCAVLIAFTAAGFYIIFGVVGIDGNSTYQTINSFGVNFDG